MSHANEGPRLWLLRHGETEWSKSGQHTGKSDIPLTDHGRAQATKLRSVLAPIAFTHVFTSPRQRAKDTCALAGCADRRDAPATVVEELAEWDYGEYEGITSPKIRETNPTWSLWNDGAPGGESPAEVCARVDRLIGRLAALHGDVALFAHGHVLRVVALRWLDWPLPLGAQLALDTATIGKLGITSGKRSLDGWNRSV